MWGRVEEVLAAARRTGYRALLVLGGDRGNIIERLSRYAGECALIGDSRARRGLCGLELSPARYREILGGEHSAVIVSMESMLRPSIVAAAGEAVRGGGFLALVGPPWEEWSLGPRGGPGHYKEYLGRRIPSCRLHAWADIEAGVMSWRARPGRPPPPWDPSSYRSRRGVPRRLLQLARTPCQARALEEGLSFLRGRERSLLVLGDRGRGKSFVTGLILALGVYFKHVGNAAVVGPSPESVQQVFAGLARGLEALGVRYRERRGAGGAVVRIAGAWFRISYEPPDRRIQEPLAVVDEAASVGPARARRIAWRTPKTIISTTIHGYEGSGRALALLMEKWLPRPYTRVVLERPVRYPPGDPLEEWLYDTFMLRPDPAPARLEERPRYRLLERSELARDPGLLRSVYTLLAQAHYRTSPDSLLLLLEAEHHTVHAIEDSASGSIVAVAEVVDESAGGEAALAAPRLELMAGASPGRVARVSRIAVSPPLQRRGLGSSLLRSVEEWAAGEGYSVIAALYSRHEVARFWARNGYRPFYASPRYNRATGEKNLGHAKPLAREAERVVGAAHCEFARRLLLLAPSIYRDLDAETVRDLLDPAPRCPGGLVRVTPAMERRLRLFLESRIGYEQAMDSLLAALAERILAGRGWPPPGITGEELLLVIARIIQGKPLDDAARIAGAPLEGAAEKLENTLRRMLAPQP